MDTDRNVKVMWMLKLQAYVGFKFRNINIKIYISEATNVIYIYLLLKVFTS
jgi:hypothetical protein